MRGFKDIFRLELVAFMRSKTLALLMVVCLAWLAFAPRVLTGDGTVDGAREIYLRYGLGGVFVVLIIALLASATGSLARERTAKRLQLTMVRPVRPAVIVWAKFAALEAVGAAVLLLAVVLTPFLAPESAAQLLARPCNHALKPILPTPREEAKLMYEVFMKDPETPAEVKKADRAVVLRLLENRAGDHYQTVPTNETVVWRFAIPTDSRLLEPSVRMRFTNQYDMRQDVRGEFRFGGFSAAVSNLTQSVVTIPLVADSARMEKQTDELVFRNYGGMALMLRPRKDLDLLLPADSFFWNLVRTYGELISVLALVLAFGLFLSASLGRPVALFVAIVTLVLGEMCPSVVEQFPDELETKAMDRLGLALSRVAVEVTRPITALNPLESLALDECVEFREVLRVLIVDLALVPALLALLAGVILPRKHDAF